MIALVDRWLLAPAPAERLAALRVLICGFVVAYLVVTIGEFDRVANRAAIEFEAVGIIRLIDSPVSSWIVWAAFIGAVVSGVAATLGAWFRLSGPTFAVLVLIWASYHSSWGQMLHFEHLFTIHVLILAFSPAADAWSVDARSLDARSLDARRGNEPPVGLATRFGWPIRLMALATAITYVIAGIAKVRIGGIAWIDGSTLQNHIAYSATRLNLLGGFEPPLAEFVVRQAWMLAPMAVVALVIELAAPVALVGRTARTMWVVSALALHLATAATMLVWFPYQGLGFAFLPFFHVEEPLKRRIGKSFRSPGTGAHPRAS